MKNFIVNIFLLNSIIITLCLFRINIVNSKYEIEFFDTLKTAKKSRLLALLFKYNLKNDSDIFKFNFKHLDSLIGNNENTEFNPFYKLPQIKNVEYIELDPLTKLVDNNIFFSKTTPLILKDYSYRLPNIYQFDVYYLCNTDKRPESFLNWYITNGSSFPFPLYGYLIVYNPLNQSAKILTIFYSVYIDAVDDRYFNIDKNYKIIVANQFSIVGEEEEAAPETINTSAYEVLINKNGGFNIKRFY